MIEKITHEPGNDEAWVCICGNTPESGGFYSCLDNGDECEPDQSWGGKLFVCNGNEEDGQPCGRIIDGNTLEVVGQNREWKPLAV